MERIITLHFKFITIYICITGNTMAVKSKESNNEWFSGFAGTSLIYRIMEDVMSGKDREDRIRAVKSLGERGDPRAVETLMECCGDQDPEIRIHAIEALSRLKSGRSAPILIEHPG